MTLQGTVRQAYGVMIIDLSGRITLGEASALLRTLVRDLLANGQNKIVLNLADVLYIDSAGIGELVSGYTAVRKEGGELKLLHLNKKIRDLLQITKLYTVFDVHSDERTAASSFH